VVSDLFRIFRESGPVPAPCEKLAAFPEFRIMRHIIICKNLFIFLIINPFQRLKAKVRDKNEEMMNK
jgi:hypothetical protein